MNIVHKVNSIRVVNKENGERYTLMYWEIDEDVTEDTITTINLIPDNDELDEEQWQFNPIRESIEDVIKNNGFVKEEDY